VRIAWFSVPSKTWQVHQRNAATSASMCAYPCLEVAHHAGGKVEHESVEVELQLLLVSLGDHHQSAARHIGLVRPRLDGQAEVHERSGVSLIDSETRTTGYKRLVPLSACGTGRTRPRGRCWPNSPQCRQFQIPYGVPAAPPTRSCGAPIAQ
jgi:hypothetical protein